MRSKGDIPLALNAEVTKMAAETIEFLTATGLIEESAGRRKFQVPYDVDVREYEKKMLCSCECRYTIPMHFLTEDHKLKAFYDFTGSIQLKDYARRKIQNEYRSGEDHERVADVLRILSEILECIKGMENYLIFPDRVTVHTDIVFIDMNTGRTALAFYPNESPEQDLQGRIGEMVSDLSGMFHSDEADQYLHRIEEFIAAKNPGLDGMIRYLESMRREAGYIYWNAKNFRSMEEHKPVTNQDRPAKSRSSDFRRMAVAVQLILAVGLVAVYLSGNLSQISFAGLVILTGAADLMTSRKLLGMYK